jgi:hypothetical protein
MDFQQQVDTSTSMPSYRGHFFALGLFVFCISLFSSFDDKFYQGGDTIQSSFDGVDLPQVSKA